MSKADPYRVSGYDKNGKPTWQNVDAKNVEDAKQKATKIEKVVIVTKDKK